MIKTNKEFAERVKELANEEVNHCTYRLVGINLYLNGHEHLIVEAFDKVEEELPEQVVIDYGNNNDFTLRVKNETGGKRTTLIIYINFSNEGKLDVLHELYNNRCYSMKILMANEKGKECWWRVDTYRNDCKVGHFGINHWFRTPKGIEKEPYYSLRTMINAIKQVAEGKGYVVKEYKVIDDNEEVIRAGKV